MSRRRNTHARYQGLQVTSEAPSAAIKGLLDDLRPHALPGAVMTVCTDDRVSRWRLDDPLAVLCLLGARIVGHADGGIILRTFTDEGTEVRGWWWGRKANSLVWKRLSAEEIRWCQTHTPDGQELPAEAGVSYCG